MSPEIPKTFQGISFGCWYKGLRVERETNDGFLCGMLSLPVRLYYFESCRCRD